MLVASEKENDDLFWALRGGSGNFGVVTTFEYRMHPVAEIYGGPIAFPVDRAEDILRFYREYIAEAPEELGGFVGFHLAPPLPFLPEEWHFKNVCLAVLCWTGPIEEGEKRVQPFLDVVQPVGAHVGAMPYPALNVAFDELLPPGLQAYWKASFRAGAERRGCRRARGAWRQGAVAPDRRAPVSDRRCCPTRRCGRHRVRGIAMSASHPCSCR